MTITIHIITIRVACADWLALVHAACAVLKKLLCRGNYNRTTAINEQPIPANL